MLALAIRWQNDMVMCFDENGAQILDLQGPYAEVGARVLDAAGPKTDLGHGDWLTRKWYPVSQEDW